MAYFSGRFVVAVIVAIVGLIILMMNDTSSAEARIQRCPQCGNDTDEFGNKP